MQPIKIFRTLLGDAKVTFNPEKMEALYIILSLYLLLQGYHDSKKEQSSITYFITCLLQEKQGLS
jgi:hypothetical protein